MRYLSGIVLVLLFILACEPSTDADIDLGALPESPSFAIDFVNGNTNKVIISDQSTGTFNRLWELPGGEPSTSTQKIDTISYFEQGVYPITLHVAAEGGSGTNSNIKSVEVLTDANLDCDDKLALLTGNCGSAGKCWVFSFDAAAIGIGPVYGSIEWFTSAANDLVPEQYDDKFCFSFTGRVYEYQNNGATINPWNGYQAEEVDFGVTSFNFLPGAGQGGRDQIQLNEGQIMGVWDSGHILDIELMTETELVVSSQLVGVDGVPAAEGWFQQRFIAE